MANLTVEELKVLISAETAGLQKSIKNVQNQLQGLDKTTTKVTTKMNNAFTKIAKSAGITLTIAGLVKLGKSAVQAASDLEEVQNVVDVAFGEAAAEINRFAKTCLDRFGLSEYSAKKLASQFMAMGSSMGIANKNSKTMSVQLTGLAADLASFFNVSVETAQNALEGIYTGQTRALRQFGLVVDQATIQEYALSQGITKSVSAMTAAEQATLRYNYVLQQTTNAQNDFSRTAGSWANQIRLLRQQWNAFMTELGSVITAVLIPIVKWLNTILAYLTAIVKAFKAVFNIGKKDGDETSKTMGDMATSAGGFSDNLGTAAKNAKELKKTIAGFDELEILNGPNDDSGSGAGDIGAIGGGGYDVGTYFDPEAFNPTDLTEFQEKVEGIIAVLKDFTDYILGPVTNAVKKLINYIHPLNEETGEREWDWSRIFSLAGLIAAIATIGSIFKNGFKKAFAYLNEEYPNTALWKKLLVAAKFGIEKIKKLFKGLGGLIGSVLKPIGTILNKWLIQPLLHPIKTLKTLGTAFKTIFTSIGKVIGNLIGNIGNLITSFIQCCKEFGFFHTLGEVIKDLLIAIKTAFKNLWGVIAAHPLAAAVAAIALVAAAMVDLYNKNEKFRKALDELWRNVLKPVVDYVIAQAQYVWNSILKPLWNNIKGMVGDLITLVTSIWNKLSEFIGWIGLYILPPITMVVGEIIACTTRIFGNVVEVVNGIITAIRGIITFLTGVFSGDWKKAWEGIKSVFKGIWDGMVGLVKGPVNLIIGILNTLLGGLEGVLNSVGRVVNKLKITIPDWVPVFGGRTYGFEISTVALTRIPYLAAGGVLDEPTAAMMGEYAGAHNNPEIVTPENLMRQIVMEGNDDLADTFIAVGRQIVAAIQDNNLEIRIGDDVISAAAARGDRDFRKRTGRSQFAV